MEDFIPLTALSATVFTIVSLIRFLSGRQWGSAGTIVTVWTTGVVVLWLFAQSNWASSISTTITGGVPLDELNFASLVILGLQVGSTATAFNELRGAIARTTEPKPKLLSGR